MINIIELLRKAQEHNIIVYVEDGKLLVKKTKNQILDTTLIIEELKENKNEILNFLEEKQKINHQNDFNHITKINRNENENFPLSYAQERLWFIDKLQGSHNYHIPTVLKIEGLLDVDHLENAFIQVIDRHEILRTVYIEENGEIFQKNLLIDNWELNVINLEDKNLQELINREIVQPYNLSEDFMLRATLIKIDKDTYNLIFVIHHIATDGWSTPILINELVELYSALTEDRTSSLNNLFIQYIDYAYWQKTHITENVLKEKLSYWLEKLKNVHPLNIPTDFIRPAKMSIRGQTLEFIIEKKLSQKLIELSSKEDSTIFMTLLACFKVLLYKYTEQDDICVGIPVSNRVQQETAALIGFFVNSLAIRSDLSMNPSFIEFLQQVKQTCIGAYENQEVPFEKIIDGVDKKRDLGRTPIFQTIFSYQANEKQEEINLNGIKISSVLFETNSTKYDLIFNVSETSEGLTLLIQYCTDLFQKETIERMVKHYRKILSNVVNDSNQNLNDIEILDDKEKTQLLVEFNNLKTAYPKDKTIVDLFEEQVAKTPNNIAVVFNEIILTYRELNEKSNQLASYLRENYLIKPDNLVGIKLDRSERMIVAILGILKSGAAYVPIDPSYPQDRIDYMVSDSHCKVLIDEEVLDRFNEAQGEYSKKNIEKINHPNNLAYVIYTSGTTGNPKGVLIEHKNVVQLLKNDLQLFDFNSNDVWSMFHSYCFDFSVWEMYGALLNGSKLIIIPLIIARDPIRFLEILNKQKVTVLNQTPSVFYNVLNEDLKDTESNLQLRYVIFGGETLAPGKLADWRQKYSKVKLINMYGITETTVHVTYKEIKEEDIEKNISNIGRSIPSLSCYVLDKSQKLLPIGVEGELYIGGEGVARGYLNSEYLTAERFVKSPFKDGELLYRSGDKVRMLENGEMVYIGRKDHQVKIRGFRIELREIENAILEYSEDLKQVVVEVKENNEEKALIAYLVSDVQIDKFKLRNFLNEKLPNYMLPNFYVELKFLPLTDNDKIDRKSLPNVDEKDALRKEYVAPRNRTESILLKLWEKILGIDNIGIYDNFFELGGNSLMSTKIVALIEHEFGIKLQVSKFFEFPTVNSLSILIDDKSDEVNESNLIAINTNGKKKPIYCAPPGGGNILCYYKLSKYLGIDQPLYAFLADGLDGDSKILKTVEEMAEKHIELLLKVDKSQSFVLAGYSFGGKIIYEMSLQLIKRGYFVDHLFVIDSDSPFERVKDLNPVLPKSYSEWLFYFKDIYNFKLEQDLKLEMRKEELFNKTDEEKFNHFYKLLIEKGEYWTYKQLKSYIDIYICNSEINYIPKEKSINVPLTLFKANIYETIYNSGSIKSKDTQEDYGWSSFTSNTFRLISIDCNHIDILDEPNVEVIAKSINEIYQSKNGDYVRIR